MGEIEFWHGALSPSYEKQANKQGCTLAKDMGYKKVITYTLVTEDGASLKASNFKCEGESGGLEWTGERNPNNKEYRQMTLFPIREREKPHVMKQRWVREFEYQTESEDAKC